MADRYYTLMLIPEQTTQVKKVLLPVKLLKGIVIGVGATLLFFVFCLYFSLRYFQENGKFQLAVTKSQKMESQFQQLQNRLASSEQTLLRVRNLEQKLRVILQAGEVSQNTGIGPLTPGDEEALNAEGREGSSLAQSGSLGDFQVDPVSYRVSDLQSRSIMQEQSLQELYELLQDQKSLLEATPSVWPARGFITSRFGYRISPFTGSSQFHEGLDIADDAGTPIKAPASGVVINVETHEGFGKVITLDHGYGIVTRYGHLSEIFVRPGMRVKRGEVIAAIGNTGRSTGPHLHYEVRVNGAPANPMRYILD